ncbi:MAG TPA: GDSL-type esterase/lipase family protein [Armatimonadota bacterium]
MFSLLIPAIALLAVILPAAALEAPDDSTGIPDEDWPDLAHYRGANAKLGPPAPDEARVVFIGASMVEQWLPDFRGHFPGKPWVNRGIGGQTTPQVLVRFRQDVIDLKPRAVVILCGTNDIAGNTGPMSLEDTQNNLASMAELAKANGIEVVLASVTPSTEFPWRTGLRPAETIRTLNRWIQQYAESHEAVYLDYHSTLANAEGGFKAEWTTDGVHANDGGYAAMAPLAEAAIARALRGR